MSEVGVRELRNNLRAWLERAAGGDDVVVTDRGRPIARISGASTPPLRDRLIAAGIVTPARKPKEPIRLEDLVEARGPVSDL